MKYIDSKAPHLQTKLLSKSRLLGFHPINNFKCRPFNFENIKFYENFQKYELKKMIHPLKNMEKIVYHL
jgi:hypothetical protein